MLPDGTALNLLPERAAWCAETGELFVADLHLGKAASFRHLGIPIPEGDAAHDLERLKRLMEHLGAEDLWILGDLFHDQYALNGQLRARFADWLTTESGCGVHLVEGNHDRKLRDWEGLDGLERSAAAESRAGWGLTHNPCDLRLDRGPGLAGHLHPGVRIGTAMRRLPMLPCFLQTAGGGLILPAFGSFTGCSEIRSAPGDSLFAIDADRVFEVPPRLVSGRC